jgi:hypothetical protein
MRAYVLTTGVIFGLLVVAHIWRVFAESANLATDPFYILITLASAMLTIWAARLLWPSRPAGPD